MEEAVTKETVYYHITTVSRLLNIRTQTIMKYEELGLIRCESIPYGGETAERCVSDEMINRLRRIKWLTADLGVNLAGVEVILQLLDRLEELA